jgi:hypothetical protein
MLRQLSLLLSIVFGLSQDEQLPSSCIMPLSSRQDAWNGEFALDDCEKLGHCWAAAPSSMPEVPWCFRRSEDNAAEEACAAASTGARRECAGAGNITPRSCTERGCCWAPTDDDGPWCFWPAGTGDYAEAEMAAWDDDAAEEEF